jgi:titin
VVALQNLSDPTNPGDPPAPVPDVPADPVLSSGNQPAPVNTTVNFSANPASIAQGQCSTLRWLVEGAREVYFEGVGVTGNEQQQQCPTQTTTYTLTVVFQDGSARNYTATVTVTAAQSGGPPPAAPTNLRVTSTTKTTARIAWTDNANNETGFEIGIEGRDGLSANANATQIEATGLTCNRAYNFRVRALNAAGSSAWSNIVTAQTLACDVVETAPTAPTNLRVTSTTKTSARIAWTDNANNETGFEIGIEGSPSLATNANATQIEATGLTCNRAYNFRVRALSAAGNSAWSNIVTAQTLACDQGPQPPTAPSNLRQATTSLLGKVALQWNDNSNNEDGFDIERLTDVGATRVATASANATSANVDAPPCGTTHQFQVSARNSAGYSAASNKLSVAGICASSGVPAKPVNLRVQSVTATAINLFWDDPATNETRFEILQTGKSAPVAQTNANDHTAQILNAPCAQTFEFRVRACNAQGCSDLSNAASATTPACPTKPLVITGVKVTITPENFSGPCPYTVNLSGTISATGTGTVKYQWVLNGEAKAVRELAFDGAATKAVEVPTWTVKSGTNTHTARLKVLDQVGEPFAEDKIGVYCSQ